MLGAPCQTISFILQINEILKLLMPNKKGKIYGAVWRMHIFGGPRSSSGFFPFQENWFPRSLALQWQEPWWFSQTCEYLFLVSRWHDLTKVAKGCPAKILYGQCGQKLKDFYLLSSINNSQCLLIHVFKDNRWTLFITFQILSMEIWRGHFMCSILLMVRSLYFPG